MTAIADDVEHGEARTPMLFVRFRTWPVMVAVVVILCGMLRSAKAPALQVDLA